MKEIILAKFGELVLKGLNRRSFEAVIEKNTMRALEPIGKFSFFNVQSTIYIECEDDGPFADTLIARAKERVRDIFGFVSVSTAAATEKDMDAIAKTAKEYLAPTLSTVKTFKVEAKRSDKRFPLKSPEICREIGGVLLSTFHHLKVDVHNPDVTVYVEIRDRGAYIHCGREQGAGGLPVGTSGKATLLLSGGIDSPVAGYMMARRGVSLSAVYFSTPPYTSERATQKVIDLAKIVSRYAGPFKLFVVPFTHIQEEIAKHCRSELFTIIMRRFMFRCAEKICLSQKGGALITGESLGQVASQTIPAISVTGEVVSIPVFQPLIGMDKEEITRISRKIGAFETSILPYEDCCALFSPKHPKTHPRSDELVKEERHFDIDALVDEALRESRLIRVDYDGETVEVEKRYD